VDAERMSLAEAGARIGRWRVRYVALDSADPKTGAWAPEVVSANARNAAQDKTTIAYLGEMDTGASAVSIPILNEPGILQVSPSDTVAGYTRRGANPGEPEKYYPARDRTFARLVPPDDIQAAAQVSLMQDAGVKNVFVINDGALYGRTLALGVGRAAMRAGTAIADRKTIDPGRTDPVKLGQDIVSSGADAVFFGGVPQDDSAVLLGQIARAAPTVKLYVPNALAVPAVTSALDKAAQAKVSLTIPTLGLRNYPPAAAQFYRRFRDRYGREPTLYAIFGYEAMRVVLASIRAAGADGNRRDLVTERLLGSSQRGTVLGDYRISATGDTSIRVYGAYRLRDGLPAFARVVDPFGA
jgi:branched-chain amino acid transport system substrate-binding protein